MTKRKAEWSEVSQWVQKILKEDIKSGNFHPKHLKVLVEELYPFSWKRYCKARGIDWRLREK